MASEEPQGGLTPAQYEILQAVWHAGAEGASVGQIWRWIGERREVARTTVQNLVERLDRRGWLRRTGSGRSFRYRAVRDRDTTDRLLAGEFVADFFDGSPGRLVQSLLGSAAIDADQVRRLRRMLDDHLARETEDTP